MPFPDSVDDKLNVEGLNVFSMQDYQIEAAPGRIIDLRGDVRVNGDRAAHLSDLPFVDSRDFNLVGNNVADDTIGLQAFLNASPTKLHYLRSPSVKYRTTSTLTLPIAPGFHLTGESRWLTVIELDASNTPILKFDGTAQFNHNYTLEHFCLQYKVAQAAANTNAIGLQLTGHATESQTHWYYCSFRDLRIHNSRLGLGVKRVTGLIQDTWNCTFERIDFGHTSYGLIDLRSDAAMGYPVNYLNMITHIGQTAPYKGSGAAFAIDGEVRMQCIDVEDWAGIIVENFDGIASLDNFHIERHVGVTGSKLFIIYGTSFTLDNYSISYDASSTGSNYYIIFGDNANYIVGAGKIETSALTGATAITMYGLGASARLNRLGRCNHVGNATWYNREYYEWEATVGTLIENHGSATWDPASVANGAMISTTVTVYGAAIGDPVAVGFSLSVPAGVQLTGAVTAADTVTVTMMNHSGGAVDLGSGILRARIWKDYLV